jgi:hypothetical protein
MFSFYSTNTFLIIISCLAVVYICVMLYNLYKENKAKLLATSITRSASTCPDYWDSIGNGRCQNTNSLGSCSKEKGANIMDFSGEIFTNKTMGDYAKCKWASACNVSWSNINRLC